MKAPTLPRHYYHACSQDGEVSTSRFGADDDQHAAKILRDLLGKDIPASVNLYRHNDTGRRMHQLALNLGQAARVAP